MSTESALRDVTRRYLEATAVRTADEHVAAHAAPPDRAAWKQMAEQVGLQGVSIAERYGGSGLGRAEELLVHHEMGRALYRGPYLSTTQVAAALGELTDDPVSQRRLEAIAAGDLVAAPCLPVEETFPLSYPVVTRSPSGGLSLTGGQPLVVDAQVADALLVLADFEGFHAFFWLDTAAEGVAVVPLETVDLTRPAAAVRFDAAPVELVAEQDRARAAVAAVRQGTALALAAECVGVAERALEMTVEYVKVRTQFGRTIGSFQAVKHTCADLHVDLEAARSALRVATRAVEENDLIGRRPASLAGLAVARTWCGRTAFETTREAIHLHGGIGFTWEHPAHLYYRRATANRALLDSTGQQSRLLAASVRTVYEQEAAAT